MNPEQKKPYKKPELTTTNSYEPTTDYYKDEFTKFMPVRYTIPNDPEAQRRLEAEADAMERIWKALSTRAQFVCALIMKHASLSEFIALCELHSIKYQRYPHYSYAYEIAATVAYRIRTEAEDKALATFVQALPELKNPKPIAEQQQISTNEWHDQHRAKHEFDDLFSEILHNAIAELFFYLGIDPKLIAKQIYRLDIDNLHELVRYVARHQMAQGQPTLKDISAAANSIKQGTSPELNNSLVEKRNKLLKKNVTVNQVNLLLKEIRQQYPLVGKELRAYGWYVERISKTEQIPSALRACLFALQSLDQLDLIDSVLDNLDKKQPVQQ